VTNGVDDGGHVGNTQAVIQRAITALATTGGEIHIGPGTYTFSSGLTLGAVDLIFKGSGSSTTIFSQSGIIDMITMNQPNSYSFHDMRFNMLGTGGSALVINNANTIFRCIGSYFYHAASMNNGILIENKTSFTGGQGFVQDCIFDLTITTNTAYGLYGNSSILTNWMVENCLFKGHATPENAGIFGGGLTGKPLLIDNCRFDNAYVDTRIAGTVKCSNCSFNEAGVRCSFMHPVALTNPHIELVSCSFTMAVRSTGCIQTPSVSAGSYTTNYYILTNGCHFNLSTGVAIRLVEPVDGTDTITIKIKSYNNTGNPTLSLSTDAGTLTQNASNIIEYPMSTNVSYTTLTSNVGLGAILNDDKHGVVKNSSVDPTTPTWILSNNNFEQESTGVLTGGILSIGSPNTTYSISDGTGIVINAGVKTLVSWSGLTNQAVAKSGILTFITINSSGVPQAYSSRPSNTTLRNEILLGVLVHTDSIVINAVNNEQRSHNQVSNQLCDLVQEIGFINSGNTISSSGSALRFQKAAGTLFYCGSNFKNDSKNPNQLTLAALDTNVSDTYQIRYQDGSSSALTLVDFVPNVYDNGGAYGTGSVITANKWAVHRCYSFISNALKIQAPQNVFNSKSEAISGVNNGVFVVEPSILSNGMLVGYIVARGGATDLSDSNDAVFLSGPKFSGGVSAQLGSSVSTLQQAYDNSYLTPLITTSTTGGEVLLKRGTGSDADVVIGVQNGAGTTNMSVCGTGCTTVYDLDVTAPTGTASSITGCIRAVGGIATQESLWCEQKMWVNQGVDSSSKTSGSLIVTGGVGVSAKLYADQLHTDKVSIDNTGIMTFTAGEDENKITFPDALLDCFSLGNAAHGDYLTFLDSGGTAQIDSLVHFNCTTDLTVSGDLISRYHNPNGNFTSTIGDNQATPWKILDDSANEYMSVVSTTSDKKVVFGQKVTVTGTLTCSNDIDMTGGNSIFKSNTPASASATGVAGTITYDASYVYVCTATDTWKRVAIATW
jgi:hypothetical protein